MALVESLAIALQYLNPGVVERIRKETGVTMEEATQIFTDTKMFLWLCANTSKAVAPSPAIDEGWHAFILFTRDYERYCLKFLGRFIHHQPHVGEHKPIDGGKALRDYTSDMVEEHFDVNNLSGNWDIIVQAKCHSKCCDKGCRDQGCHSKRDPELSVPMNKLQAAKGGDCCEQCSASTNCQS